MNCDQCGSRVKSIKIANYRYGECGLSNIYLKNIRAYECDGCHDSTVHIPNLEGLHSLIAKNVAGQASKLKPEEIRFLRVHLGLSGAQFARVLSVEPETVSRWENGKSEMKLTNERFLRILILSSVGPFREYEELCDLGLSDKKLRPSLKFSVKNDRWHKTAA